MSPAAGRRAAFLQEIGVGPLWQRRATVASAPEKEAAAPVPDVSPVSTPVAPASVTIEAIASMNWPQLQAAVAGCTRCDLCKNRTHTVFGIGDQQAKWLFIGEGPGRREDAVGDPFVGPSGKLLDNMLLAMGVARGNNVYIANIVKCRPAGEDGNDRAPTPEEVAACRPYLERQIALIQPAVIVALGKTAALSLLGRDPETPVSSLRGTVHYYAAAQQSTIPLIVTYHPAYLLRRLADKGKAWADLCLAMQAYAPPR